MKGYTENMAANTEEPEKELPGVAELKVGTCDEKREGFDMPSTVVTVEKIDEASAENVAANTEEPEKELPGVAELKVGTCDEKREGFDMPSTVVTVEKIDEASAENVAANTEEPEKELPGVAELKVGTCDEKREGFDMPSTVVTVEKIDEASAENVAANTEEPEKELPGVAELKVGTCDEKREGFDMPSTVVTVEKIDEAFALELDHSSGVTRKKPRMSSDVCEQKGSGQMGASLRKLKQSARSSVSRLNVGGMSSRICFDVLEEKKLKGEMGASSEEPLQEELSEVAGFKVVPRQEQDETGADMPATPVVIEDLPTCAKDILQTGVLEGFRITFRFGKKVIPGRIKGLGITCLCELCLGEKTYSLTEFERHCGSKGHRGPELIFLENGRNLYGVKEEVKNAFISKANLSEALFTALGPVSPDQSIRQSQEHEIHMNIDNLTSTCAQCKRIFGVICSRCYKAYHLACARLSTPPDGDWQCPHCIGTEDSSKKSELSGGDECAGQQGPSSSSSHPI